MVTGAVQDLFNAGLLVESGRALSTGGPPEILDVAPDIGGVLATDIGGINVRVAAADCRGTILYRETRSIPDPSFRRLRSLVIRLNEKARSHLTGPVRAISVAVAGIVDPATGRVSRVDNMPGWPDDSYLSWLDRFDAPCWLTMRRTSPRSESIRQEWESVSRTCCSWHWAQESARASS